MFVFLLKPFQHRLLKYKLVQAECVRCPWGLQADQSVHYDSVQEVLLQFLLLKKEVSELFLWSFTRLVVLGSLSPSSTLTFLPEGLF